MRTNLDKAMVLSFDSNAEMVSELTPDTDKLDSAIRGLHAGGGTALYDAILYGLPRQTGPGTTQL
jgi:Mg-chelatase subunit ChlD